MNPLQIEGRPDLTAAEAQEALRIANILYFRSRVYARTSWLGVQSMKCPLDMWLYQELICQLRVDLLIETGTGAGGSALFFAHLFDQLGAGRVLTIDVRADENRPRHPRIEYLTGKSVSKAVLERVAAHAANAATTMVVLDSEHRAPYKLLELHAYAPFVTTGSYLIAEDTVFDHYPGFPEFGPGPAKAAAAFLAANAQFEPDRSLERHMITFAPGGFLKRVRGDAAPAAGGSSDDQQQSGST